LFSLCAGRTHRSASGRPSTTIAGAVGSTTTASSDRAPPTTPRCRIYMNIDTVKDIHISIDRDRGIYRGSRGQYEERIQRSAPSYDSQVRVDILYIIYILYIYIYRYIYTYIYIYIYIYVVGAVRNMRSAFSARPLHTSPRCLIYIYEYRYSYTYTYTYI